MKLTIKILDKKNKCGFPKGMTQSVGSRKQAEAIVAEFQSQLPNHPWLITLESDSNGYGYKKYAEWKN